MSNQVVLAASPLGDAVEMGPTAGLGMAPHLSISVTHHSGDLSPFQPLFLVSFKWCPIQVLPTEGNLMRTEWH